MEKLVFKHYISKVVKCCHLLIDYKNPYLPSIEHIV